MRRNEIWLYDPNPAVGDEIRKIRPAVIVSDDMIGVLRLKIIVPITDWKPRYTDFPWMVQLQPTAENGLSKLSAADTFQIRAISRDRLQQYMGTIYDIDMQQIEIAIATVLNLKFFNPRPHPEF